MSLELAPRRVTALAGASGSGKSSIARLLVGSLPAESGAVLVDGVPLVALPQEAWRARLAHVAQRPHLFAGSVLDNLRLGRPEAPFDEVVAAAEDAEADGFIRLLPGGYHARLGEDGHDLSGGERQRLAIARAFVRRAELVVLDEIAAHLDAAAEGALARAVTRLARRSTLLVVAHRVATVRRADRIAVLEEGRVTEIGTHAELLARRGAYARLMGAAAVDPRGVRVG